MATEIIKSFGILQSELEQAKNSLKGVDENIKRLIGRDPSEIIPRQGLKRGPPNDDNGRGRPRGGLNRNRPFNHENEGGLNRNRSFNHENEGGLNRNRPFNHENDGGLNRNRPFNHENDEPAAKRRNTSVFKRLSERPTHYEDEMSLQPQKQLISKVIVTPREVPSRQEALAAQHTDEKSKERNRRMFGALLGTLQKFQQEETKLKSKEQKRAQVEKKIEEHEIREKAEIKKERQELFFNRKKKQAEIKMIELKMTRMKEYAAWEERQKPRANFIMTKAKPHICFLPRKVNDANKALLESCKVDVEKMIEKRRQEVYTELQHIEDRMKRGFEPKKPKETVQEEQHEEIEGEAEGEAENVSQNDTHTEDRLNENSMSESVECVEVATEMETEAPAQTTGNGIPERVEKSETQPPVEEANTAEAEVHTEQQQLSVESEEQTSTYNEQSVQSEND